MDRYEIFKSDTWIGDDPKTAKKEPRWYFRLVSKNNKIVAVSEGYNRRSQAIAAVDRVRQIAQTTAVIENLGRGE